MRLLLGRMDYYLNTENKQISFWNTILLLKIPCHFMPNIFFLLGTCRLIMKSNQSLVQFVNEQEGIILRCLLCEYKSIHDGDIKKHMKSVHEGKTFQCPHCEYKAVTTGSLKIHMQSIHEGRKFKCKHCYYEASLSKGRLQKKNVQIL